VLTKYGTIALGLLPKKVKNGLRHIYDILKKCLTVQHYMIIHTTSAIFDI